MPEPDGLVPTPQKLYDGPTHDPSDEKDEGAFWRELPDVKLQNKTVARGGGFLFDVRWYSDPDSVGSPKSAQWELPGENTPPATRTPYRYTPRKGWDTVSRAPQPWEPITEAQYTDPGRKERRRMTHGEIVQRIEALEQKLALYLDETARTAQRLAGQMPSNREVENAVEELIARSRRP